MSSFLQLNVWLYGLLVRALPGEMQRRIGDPLVQGFEDRCAAAVREGGTSQLLLVLVREYTNLVGTVGIERLGQLMEALGRRRNLGGERSGFMDTLIQDVRFALRTLTRSVGFSLVAVLTLGLGVGASTAVFSVVDAVLLRQLPYAQGEELIRVWAENLQQGFTEDLTSWPTYLEWRDQNRTLDGLAGFTGFETTLTGEGPAQRVAGAQVTPSFFDVMGTTPALGRTFSEQEGEVGRGGDVALLSHGLWQQSFGGRRDVLGQSVLVNGRPRTVIGVMPSGFGYPDDARLWIPLSPTPETRAQRGAFWLSTVGRVRDGVSIDRARADLKRVATGQAEANPGIEGLGVTVNGLHDQIVRDVRPGILMLFGAVGLVFLIACANVANLLLARSTVRTTEMAVRAAMGAGRMRVARQLITESVVLGILGIPLGILIAKGALVGLVAFAPPELPRVEGVGLNPAILGVTAGMVGLASLLFGLAPALSAMRTNLRDGLLAGGHRGATGRGRGRSALVIGEVALSVVLLVSAGMLVQSFQEVTKVDPGFAADELLSVELSAVAADYPQPEDIEAFFSQMIEGISTISGVESASAGSTLLISSFPNSGFIRAEDQPVVPREEAIEVLINGVAPNYFATIGTPLIAGREFDQGDGGQEIAVVINESMQRLHWADEDPIGKRFAMGREATDGWFRIIGVVGDIRRFGNDRPTRAGFYAPLARLGRRTATVMVRTSLDPASMVAQVRAEIRGVNPNQAIPTISPLTDQLGLRVAEQRFTMLILIAFSGVALLLSVAGVYGVLAYTVAQRTREIGVRMALGAEGVDVIRMVMGQGGRLVTVGAATGILGALVVGRVLSGRLYGVSGVSPTTVLLVTGVLLLAALGACLVPARRATQVDSMVAMRES